MNLPVLDGPGLRRLLDRRAGTGAGLDPAAEAAARKIVEDVRLRGDDALLEFTCAFDGVDLARAGLPLEVTGTELQAAVTAVDGEFRAAVAAAVTNIRTFHERELQAAGHPADRTGWQWEVEIGPGVRAGQRCRPLDTVGIYVPGGTAPLASTVLMTAVPARVAGVRTLVMCTPPGRSGAVDVHILAAAAAAGVDRVFRVGGAQAIAAMAFGTCAVPRVDKIVGPGNTYVTAAKRLVFGTVDIDMLAGPSEIVILAGPDADPEWLAADLLSQAEHDEQAAAILITTSADLARRTASALEGTLAALPRAEIAARSLTGRGALVVVRDLEEGIDLVNAIAPEHLEVVLPEGPALEAALRGVRHAGAVFCGPHTPEPIGDYIAGPSHVLPTGGTARFSSPLSAATFLKRSSVISCNREGFSRLMPAALTLARREGLAGHAGALIIREQTSSEIPAGRRSSAVD